MANTKVTSNVIADNAVGITQLNVSDGSDGQALVTNGAGTLSFATVGVSGISSSADATAITINSSEQVGIGETSPLGKLHAKVSDTGASASAQGNLLVLEDTENGLSILSSTSAAGYINFGDSDDNDIGMIIYDHSANAMRFWTNAAERMRITSTGNVGIGMTAAVSKVHIQGPSASTYTGSGPSDVLRVSSSAAGAWIASDFDGMFGYMGLDDSTTAKFAAYNYATSTEGNMILGQNRMYIKNNGNVGIGTSSPSRILDVEVSGGNAIGSVVSGTSNIAGFVFGDTSADDQGGVLYDNSSDFLYFRTGGAERARIDLAGRFAIGVTNPSDYYATNLVVQGASEGGITIASTSTSVANYIMFADGTSGDARYRGYIGYNHSSDQMAFASAGTESAFIDSGGRFTFGGNFAHSTYAHAAVFGKNSTPLGTVVIEDFDVSSGIGNTVLNLFLRDQDPATNAIFIDFRDGGGRVGSVTHNDDGGGVSFNTTSDYRLKENVNYDWDATTLLKKLKPAKFNFKRNPSKTIQGMLAHEVMDIVPSSVRGDKDHMEPIGTIKDSDGEIVYEGVYEHFTKTDEGQTWEQTGTEPLYQELDYSRLVPLLTKALQELEAKIETLEAEVKELKGE